MKEAKPVRFRQIAVVPDSENCTPSFVAIDMQGRVWAASLTSRSGLPYPPDKLPWIRCAMPPDEQP